MNDQPKYGEGDATFRAAGGVEGVRALVNSFYDIMSSDPEYRTIRSWHSEDDAQMRDKLALFLCGWMNGPRLYNAKYGPISIPGVHAHLNISNKERDQWLSCMSKALAKQKYPQSLKSYLLEQFAIPAERIRVTCQQNQSN